MKMLLKLTESSFLRKCLWAVTVTALSIASSTTITASHMLFFVFPACFCVVLFCVTALWPKRSPTASCVLLSTAHSLTLALYGVSYWTARRVPDPVLPCFTPALQILAAQMNIPLRFQLVPMLTGIIIPLSAYPSDYFQPLPLILVAASLIVTILSCPHPSNNNNNKASHLSAKETLSNSVVWRNRSEGSHVGLTSSNSFLGRLRNWLLNQTPDQFMGVNDLSQCGDRSLPNNDPSNSQSTPVVWEDSNNTFGSPSRRVQSNTQESIASLRPSYSPPASVTQRCVQTRTTSVWVAGESSDGAKRGSGGSGQNSGKLPVRADVEEDLELQSSKRKMMDDGASGSEAGSRMLGTGLRRRKNEEAYYARSMEESEEVGSLAESRSTGGERNSAGGLLETSRVAVSIQKEASASSLSQRRVEPTDRLAPQVKPVARVGTGDKMWNVGAADLRSDSVLSAGISCRQDRPRDLNEDMLLYDCDEGSESVTSNGMLMSSISLVDQQYAVLKVLLDEEEQAKKKAQEEVVAHIAEARELAHKYQVLKDYFNEILETNKKLTTDIEHQFEQNREFRLKYEILKERFDELVEARQKKDEECERQWKESLELKLRYAIVKGQYDEIAERRKTGDHGAAPNPEIAEMQYKFDVLKARFDRKEERCNELDAQVQQETTELRELRRKYALLKESFIQGMEEKKMLEETSERTRQGQIELQQKNSLLSELVTVANEEKKTISETLEKATQEAHEWKLKYSILKVYFDKGMKEKKKAEETLLEEASRAKELQMKYEMLKERFDEGVEETKHAEDALAQQCDQTRDLQNLYSLMKTMFDKKKLQCSQQEENLSLAASHIKVLRWMLQKSSEVEDPPAFSEPLQTLARSDNLSTELSTLLSNHFDESSSMTNISHDMRTPLTTAISVLEILMDDKVKLTDTDRQDLLQNAWSALQTILIMVNNIIDFNRLRNAGIHPVPKQVNMRRLAVQALRTLEIQATQSKVEFILEASTTLPTSLHCDRVLLQRVLVNLLSNALKSTPANGKIVLGMRWDATRNLLQASVTDNGVGMAMAEQNAAFNKPFASSTHGGKGGTDLGLSVCHRLVTKMGGSISAFSKGKDQGSIFSFEILAPVSKNIVNTVDYTVLVVDDDPVRHRATEAMLKYAGLCLLETSLDAEKPGIVFVSVAQTSWETIARYWKQNQHVIVCLIVPNTAVIKSSHSAFADAVLHSPIDISELREVLRRLANCSGVQSDSSSHPNSDSTPASDVKKEDILVLLTEDNQVNHKLFLRQLANVGLTNVHSAYDGAEAVRMAGDNRYTIIIMDCQMPILDGYDATRRIREIPAHASTPIICLTANHSGENMERCRECGMTEFFTKPMTPQNWQAILSIAEKRMRHVEVMGSQT